MRAYRDRLRAQGLRPVTVWVPDLRSPEVRAAIEEECRRIAASPEEQEVMAWIEANMAWPDRDDDIPALRAPAADEQ
jgi:hypothetical protein